jgi:hypothetical protein
MKAKNMLREILGDWEKTINKALAEVPKEDIERVLQEIDDVFNDILDQNQQNSTS